MPREFSAGTVYVQVLPSLDGWAKDLQKQLTKELRDVKANVSVGTSLDPKGFQDELDKEMERAKPTITPKIAPKEGEAREAGAKAAGAFADAFAARMRAVLKALPDVEVGADTTGVDADIARIREELASLADQTIGIDISDADAMAALEVLHAQLAALDSKEVTISARVNMAAALAEMESLQAAASVDGDRAAGSFADAFAARLAAALQDLPEIEVDADTGPVDAAIAHIRADLASLAGLTIGVDISDADALARLRALQERLADLDGAEVNIEARANIAAAVAELASMQATSIAEGARDGGLFGREFTSHAQAAMAALPSIELDADSTDVDRAVAAIRADLESLSDKTIGFHLGDEEAIARLELVRARLAALDGQTVSVALKADIAGAVAKLEAFGEFAQGIGKAEGERAGGAFSDAFTARVTAAVKSLPDIELRADASEAQRELSHIRAELVALSGKRIGVDISDAQALAELGVLRMRLAYLTDTRWSATIRFDAADALAKLGLLEAQANALNGKTVNVDATVDDHGSINLNTTRMERLAGAVVAGAGAIGGLGAAFIALAAGAAVGAAGLLAVAVGIKSIRDAMKAQTAASLQAGQTVGQEAAQRLSAANQVLSAQDSIASAMESVANAAVGAARAERSAAEGVRTALLSQAHAEQQLQAAQVSALRAQTALTAARLDATRSIEDLKNQVVDDALAQRSAVLDLQVAQDRLNETMADSGATELQREQAQLTFDEAQQHLTEIGIAYQRSTVDSAAAAAAGVGGAEQVVSAQDSLAASQRQVADAQLAAGEASRKVDEARVNGAESVASAQQQVVSAQRGLAQAQRSLGQAQAGVATQSVSQGTAMEKLRESMEKLSLPAQNLITYLRAQTGEWDQVRFASQKFAPGLQSALQTLQPSFGALADNVGTLSASAGEFLKVIAGGLVQAEPFFDQVALASTSLFPRFGESVTTAGSAFGTLVLAMLPVVPQALDTVDAFSGLVAGLAPFIAQASGPLLDSLQSVIEDLGILGPLLVTLAKPAGDLTAALVGGLSEGLRKVNPALGPFLQALVDIVATLAPLLGSVGTLAGVFMNALTPALRMANAILKPIVDTIGFLVDVTSSIATPLLAFVIALRTVKLVVGPLQGMLRGAADGVTAMGVAASTSAAATGRGASGVGKFATAASKAGTLLGKVGNALPVVGIGFALLGEVMASSAEDAAKTAETVDKLATGLVRGGSAAREARADIEGWKWAAAAAGDSWTKTYLTVGSEAEKAAKKQIDSMSSVDLAQAHLTQAQLDYDVAVRTFGEHSPAAIGAHGSLQVALEETRDAQQKAADATKTHTERLQDQQDQILGMTDANAAAQRADTRLAEAKTALGAAIAKFGAGSPEAKSAQLDLVEAQSRYISTTAAAATATAKANGVQDVARAKAIGTRDALRTLIQTQGEELPPSILSMIGHLDEADKKFLNLTTRVDTTGQTILQMPGAPGQPPISISFIDNVPQIQKDLGDLELSLGHWFDNYTKLVNSAPVLPNPLLPLPGVNMTPVPRPVSSGGSVAGHAAGGLVGGTGSTDNQLTLLTPGEFVFSRPAVDALGADNLTALHGMLVSRYAAGGLVTSSGAQAGSAAAAGGSGSTAPLIGQLAGLADALTAIVGAGTPVVSMLSTSLVPALQGTLATSALLATGQRDDWRTITTSTSGAVGAITGQYLPALRAGLALSDAAIANTAQGFATRWGAIRQYAADPVRYALQYPFNAGLIAAWNVIDSTFAVGKHLNPIPIPFATGGGVFGGVPGRDSVPAYLMPGEFVVPTAMVNQIGMGNLESARRSVLTGGTAEGLIPGYEAGGAVGPALAFAAAQVGKPYVWGAVGPSGYDCSGLMSAVANVALGQSPYDRRFTTADFAAGRGAGGFLPGRGSSFVIGVSGSHMAGTLAGHNMESTTKNGVSGVRVDGDASGALDGQFTKGQFYLPEVGGTFIPGPTGGAPFDLSALLAGSFASTRDAIAGVGAQFAGNTIAAGATAELAQMVSSVISWATTNLTTGAGVAGSGPVLDQVRGVAARYGWGEGPEWDALSTLVSHESGWNPAAQNPSSTAYGLFQFLDSTWAGTGTAKTSNPALQAEAGMKYIQGRYGDPIGAWNFWNNAHWYDTGGYLPPGLSLAYNGTGSHERVMTAQQELAMTPTGGGQFTGQLYLDSGQFMGVVAGEVTRANDMTGRALVRRTR